MIFHDIIGNFGNCTNSNPCGEDEGDCDHDGQCKENHMCGNNNCRSSLGFEYFYDCCYSLEEDICTNENPCGEDQGDCDHNFDCLDELVCGFNNCPASLGYDLEVDCCYDKLQIRRHQETVHEGRRDYKCEICGQRFAGKGGVQRHIKTVHEGRKDHKCEYCGESRTTSSSLKKHILTHFKN